MAEEAATVETYESTLKEVVNGKRLSASKMNKLTEIALQLMGHDTQLVSILYRTHKALPTPSAKISSLYAFDALCRAARSQVIKKGVAGDANSEKGNAATFLLKVEGVLDGLVQDMISSGSSEAKEKTKKILDIWTKSSTFPTNVLKRLTEQSKVAVKEPSKTPTSDPRASRFVASTDVTPPPAVTTPPSAPAPPPDSAQQALLALLATAAANGQTAANLVNAGPSKPVAVTTPAQPQLEPLQLALLQQLANKVNVNVGSVPVAQGQGQPSSSFAVPHVVQQQQRHRQHMPIQHHVSGNATSNHSNYMNNQPGAARSPPHREPLPNSDRRDPRILHASGNGFGSGGRQDDGPSRGYARAGERDEYYDDRRDFRGGPPGRGRGRDDYRGGRNRDSRDFDERDRSQRRKRSRSRSPPYSDRDRDRDRDWDGERYSSGPNKRGPAPYSPPHRPSLAQLSASGEGAQPVKNAESGGFTEKGRSAPLSAPETGKDEFGRDIREASEEPGGTQTPAARQGSLPTEKGDDAMALESAASGSARTSVDPTPVAKSATPVQTGSADATQVTSAETPSGGLDSFDFTAFNPMMPASWVELGKAFEVTNGYTPSQEELMMLISGGMMAFAQFQGTGMGMGMDMNMSAEQGISGGQWGGPGQNWGGRGEGRGRGFQQRGGGNFGHGRGGRMGAQWGGGRYDNSGYDDSGYDQGQGTDAVVLGGSDGGSDAQNGHHDIAPSSSGGSVQSPDAAAGGANASSGGGGSAGGSMRKVGDRWVFVRNGAAS